MSKFSQNFDLESIRSSDKLINRLKNLRKNDKVNIKFKSIELPKEFYVIILTKSKVILRSTVNTDKIVIKFDEDLSSQLLNITNIEFNTKLSTDTKDLNKLSNITDKIIDVVLPTGKSEKKIEDIQLEIDYNVWEQTLPRTDKINYINDLLSTYHSENYNKLHKLFTLWFHSK